MADEIQRRLNDGEQVLWLLSGGSAIRVAVAAADRLSAEDDLAGLTVSLADERYGPPGHANSNWQQLLDAGFRLTGATLKPVLNGKRLEATAKAYAEFLVASIKNSFSIALAGIGADGHTFGIKPGSPAVDSRRLVEAYPWDDYTRITPTFNLIRRLDSVVVYAAGQEKHEIIRKLNAEVPIDDQPAQLLKKLKQTIIFNDYEGEEL